MKGNSIKKTNSNFVCLVTCVNLKEAEKIATAIVNGKLASCVNIVNGLKSIYRWKSKTCTAKETLLLIKGCYKKQRELVSAIRSLHSYDVPEIIFSKIESGFNKYIDWINNSVKKE